MSETPEQSLSVALNLPLRWRPLSDGEVVGVRRLGTQALLRVLEGLDGPLPREPAGQERELFQRLDAKLNLMLAMLSSVLSRDQLLPPSVELRLGAHQLSWTAPETPTLGQCVEISLYPHPQLPVPLVLEGKVVDLVPQAAGTCIYLQFDSLDEDLRADLEKFIFRQHRQEVRRQRGQPDTGRP